jgi:hypothetical protein
MQGPDQVIVEGDDVMLQGSSVGNTATIAWTPSSSIVSGGNTFAPVVKPPVTTNYTADSYRCEWLYILGCWQA